MNCHTALGQFEVLSQDSLHCCPCETSLQTDLPNCHPPVCSHCILNFPDIAGEAAGFAFGSSWFVCNHCSSCPELGNPLVNAVVCEHVLVVAHLESMLDLIECPAQFHTEMYVNMLLQFQGKCLHMLHCQKEPSRSKTSLTVKSDLGKNSLTECNCPTVRPRASIMTDSRKGSILVDMELCPIDMHSLRI